MMAEWPVNRQNNYNLTALKSWLCCLFTGLVCDYFDQTWTQQIYISIESLLYYYRYTLYHQQCCFISAICSSILSPLNIRRSACHCSRPCTAKPWYLQCVATPSRWSKPRELFLPPVTPSSLCQIRFTSDSAPLQKWSARKLNKTR